MSNIEKLIEMGFEDVEVFDNYSYETALVGVSDDGRAVYDYDKMVEYLVTEAEMTTL